MGEPTPFSERLPLGKLPPEHLMRLLAAVAPADPRVVVGPRFGEDAAVLDFGDRYLVAKTDPITFATDEIGWYAVHVNANDVATTGARPRWFMATLLLPEGQADLAMAETIFDQMHAACQEIGAGLVGGHTEVTYDLSRPIVIGVMLGEVARERLVTTAGAQVGDAVVLTKGVAVEATSIIAREKRQALITETGLDASFLDRCAAFLHDPGISVVRDAQIATETAPVHAMHDPTEGGLATGLWELAQAAHVGLEIEAQAVPLFPETARLCAAFGLDPWGVIGSGSLLLTAAPADAERIVAALHQAGIGAAIIGQVVPPEQGLLVHQGDSTRPLPRFQRDEIARLFETP
ncbi:MAG: hydrogenase expression/formation protein [Chloroflexi bacterium]|nr:MAG: hydrogenase expression/formation protein [Chloroflexota bacterium]